MLLDYLKALYSNAFKANMTTFTYQYDYVYLPI